MQSFLFRKQIFLPQDHGSWVFILSPLLIGLFAGKHFTYASFNLVVAALAAMPLEALLLGGCTSLTPAIGDQLAKMRTLRVLDLSNLPLLHSATLPKLPASLERLSLQDSSRLRVTQLAAPLPVPASIA